MGTSVNRPSPNTPHWKLAKSVLGNTAFSVERQGVEIWQTAINDRSGQLRHELGDPLLALAGEIAESNNDPVQALNTFNSALNNAYAAGLVYEMGKRALARAVSTRTGSTGFASELFAETISYYVSRDLPSIVGTSGRIQTIGEAIKLKDNLKTHTKAVVIKQGKPNLDPSSWQSFVDTTLATLRRVEGAG